MHGGVRGESKMAEECGAARGGAMLAVAGVAARGTVDDRLP